MKLGGRIDISIVFLCIVRILSLLLMIPHNSYFVQVIGETCPRSLALLGETHLCSLAPLGETHLRSLALLGETRPRSLALLGETRPCSLAPLGETRPRSLWHGHLLTLLQSL